MLDSDRSQIVLLQHAISPPIKVITDVTKRINQLIASNRQMSSDTVAQIISAIPEMPKISRMSVDRVRHRLGYKFLRPITTFPLTLDQIGKQCMSTVSHTATLKNCN
jgi:hypothetical protein